MLNDERSLHEARRLYKIGRLQEALELYDLLVNDYREQAELYFERASIADSMLRPELAERDYRTCLRLEPAHLRATERLGSLLRRAMPFVGAVDQGLADANATPFMYVIGSSYVRAFSSTTLFLPLWLGPATELSFITAQRATRTQLHLLAAIARCDLANPVLLVMGNNDPIMHADNLAGTKDLQHEGSLGSDSQILEEAAFRFVLALEAILDRYPSIALFVLGGCVMFSREQSDYIRISNLVVAAHCRRLGIVFIDLNDQLTDPISGTLRPEFASSPENAHLSKGTSVGLVTERLAELGLLPAGTLPFEWSFLWHAPISPNFQVRIWGEPHTGPSNLVHSRTVAFSHAIERALHILLGIISLHDGPSPPSVLVPHCREGFVALSLPIRGLGQLIGVDPSPACILMANRLRQYFRRPEITFLSNSEGALLRDIVEPCDYVFVALDDEYQVPCEHFIDNLLDVCRHTLLILSTMDWSPLSSSSAYTRRIQPLVDKTSRPPWTAGTILMQHLSPTA